MYYKWKRKKDVIIRKYRELKEHMNEILGEEDSDTLFIPVDEFKIYSRTSLT